ATFPGGVVFALAGWNLLLGQALFAAVLVLLMTVLARVPLQGRQVSSGVVLSFGFALGTLLTRLHTGLGVPVEALLVGSPLAVGWSDIATTAAVLAVSLVLVGAFARRILFQTFDARGFAAAGFRAWPVELVVVAVIAASVVAAMPAVGAILGVAVLIGPAAAAQLLAPRVQWIPPTAAVLGMLGGLIGLWASRAFDIAAGGSIGLAMTALYLLALLGRRIAGAITDAIGARRRTGTGSGRELFPASGPVATSPARTSE
ncbi:MAG: metal ABC transporter permease, partial [Actinobacteria bacterium]|nr:metal ABC transporter permease [Actinomycetota bacterium]